MQLNNIMKKYKPTDIINFGKHKGHSIEDIYKYEPTYIEYLIKYGEDFYIDINDFYSLPNPTPYLEKKELKIGNRIIKTMTVFHGSNYSIINDGKEFINKGGLIPQIEYKFPEEFIEILDLKKENNYSAPKYEGNSTDFIKL